MPRPWPAPSVRVAIVAVGGLVAVASGGCTRGRAAPAVPVIVVPVAAVAGPPLPVTGAAPPPASSGDADGYATGDQVEVEWQGSWLPATLVERRGDRWRVRYLLGDDEDSAEPGGEAAEEIVARERIRIPVEPVEDEGVEVDVDP